jgi:hypothetical protein
MVDINLFEEEEDTLGRKDKPGDASSKREAMGSGDSLKGGDDFSLDDDLTEPSLDSFESDIEPDFVPEGKAGRSGKAAKANPAAKKVSPMVLIPAILVIIFVVWVQFFMGKPGAKKKPRTVKARTTAVKAAPDTSYRPGTAALKAGQRTPAGTAGAAAAGSGRVAKYAAATKAVLADLGRDGQFVALLLKGDRFFVEYGSAARGSAADMGRRIQGLMGASAYLASPEERHTVAGTAKYFGLISGSLPGAAAGGAGAEKFTADQFVARLNALLDQSKLANRKIQKVTEFPLNGKPQTPIRLRAEGGRGECEAFLESLKTVKGNAELVKLLVVPQEMSDMQAGRLKMVVDFSVE